MQVMEIALSVGCPNRCRYCPADITAKAYPKDAPRFMSRADAATFVSTVPLDCRMQFCGFSESFRNPSAADIIMDRHMEGRPVGLYTTLAGATLADIAKLRGVPFYTFCVHLPDDRGNSIMPASWGKQYRAVLAEVARHPFPNPRFVVHNGTVRPDLARILPSAESQGLHACAGNSRELPAMPHLRTGSCRPTQGRFDHNHVFPNGDVYQCCQDYALSALIGNLHRDQWNDLRRGPVPLCDTCEFAAPILGGKRDDRERLAEILEKDSVAVEVGVWEGGFSKVLLDGGKGVVYSVDPWARIDPSVYVDFSEQTDADWEERYQRVVELLKPYGERSVIYRGTSDDAAEGFDDNSLNLVYIDANHSYAAAQEDIRLWWPKVKPGGILAGHDYNTSWKCGVEKAVNEFAKECDLKVLVLYGEANSWCIRKP